MRYHGKLGVHRAARHVVDDVNVHVVPKLKGPYRVLGPEEYLIGGAAPKSLVVVSSSDLERHAYVAKCPGKHGARESVTEYLIACIGRALPLRIACGRLVRMPPPQGVDCDVRFLSRYFLPKKNQSLIHGIEIIARSFEMDTAELRTEIPATRAKERAFFTVDLIADVLDEVARDETQRVRLRADFARMMAFDALIGANDRHPENWGLVYDAMRPDDFEFAPVYDTARGLFWNWSDERLKREDGAGPLDERAQRRRLVVEQYALHSKPLISADVQPETEQKNPNHFEVIAHMMQGGRGDFVQPIRAVIRAFSPDRSVRQLHSGFGRLFSRRRLEYIDALLRYRHERLKKICQLP